MSNHSEGPVTVFVTTDVGLIAFVKSLLEGRGITYCVRNEMIQNMIMGTGWGGVVNPMEVQVNPEDLEAARELLKDLVVE